MGLRHFVATICSVLLTLWRHASRSRCRDRGHFGGVLGEVSSARNRSASVPFKGSTVALDEKREAVTQAIRLVVERLLRAIASVTLQHRPHSIESTYRKILLRGPKIQPTAVAPAEADGVV